MVLILGGNSEISAHVKKKLCNLICLRHLIRSKAITNHIFFLRKDIFSFICAQHVLSYHDRPTLYWMGAIVLENRNIKNIFFTMVLILDGHSVIGAHVMKNLCYLIGLRPFIRFRAVKNQFFFNSELLSNIIPCFFPLFF